MQVRVASEIYGSVSLPHEANIFNDFISHAGLVDILLGGYSFTWSDKVVTKMSKLDSFLVSEGTLEIFPNLTGFVLERHLWDHRPILLKEISIDYSPPFRVFHSWFSMDGFVQMVEDSWNNNGIFHPNALVFFKKKLHHLKKTIKIEKLIEEKGNLHCWLKGLRCIRRSKTLIVLKGQILLKRLRYIKKREFQIFFHGMLNKETQAVGNPGHDAGLLNLLYLVLRFFRTSTEGFILINQRCWIIIFTYDEIKKAVWDCGIDISPSHDGFSFGFIRRFWHLIDKDIIQAVVEFYSSIEFPYGCNTSFLVLIPKVQDAKNVKDFRPLSLIGCLYKIVGKILANGLSLVIKDDAMFIGEWKDLNIQNLVIVFHCFHLASGLKINLHKSKLFGISVNNSSIEAVATRIGCNRR
uniref:Reverse transcriptase domain-containing protein n=1 Tax=Lactuca sativa TaxID=4236 RepID=A0A9R1VCE6_LACSA|nr:hypothetical protein LSAT_V11C500296390 [Lactuca sativa]